ncbi:hypothetical protein ACKF11_13560 [Methylobacillus sp. Pita2]|uniref:hypothetical protein n=1 Tax=Methylobacillus sp. Pita2 TaxID=3383245 RepID=UPI0038B65627
MWHKVSQVAETHRLDPEILQLFAHQHGSKYHISSEDGQAMVNTWNADLLVSDFKQQLAELQVEVESADLHLMQASQGHPLVGSWIDYRAQGGKIVVRLVDGYQFSENGCQEHQFGTAREAINAINESAVNNA